MIKAGSLLPGSALGVLPSGNRDQNSARCHSDSTLTEQTCTAAGMTGPSRAPLSAAARIPAHGHPGALSVHLPS